MSVLIVTNNAKDWPTQVEDARIVDARAYLTDASFSEARGVKVFNLCRSYRYQSAGYYVSLLAEARGHKPIPSVSTVRDLANNAIVRLVSEEIDDLIQKSLTKIKSNRFALSIYFGRNMASRYQELALNLFNQFQSPLLRAHFQREQGNGWRLRRVAPIAANDVPQSHWPFVVKAAALHFQRRQANGKRRHRARFDLAILTNPQDQQPPSDAKAIKRFMRAAESMGLEPELITRDDYGRLAEFDALFIRDTTFINSYTYRFSRRAFREGLVVIDDPQSIVRCTNKVCLAELLARHKIPMPRTIVAHRDNADQLATTLGFPLILKKPDSAFSQGVVKVEDPQALEIKLKELLEDSDLVVAQEFLPTTFDWRIGVLDRQPLFACKYYMANGHWQIINHAEGARHRYGRCETIPVESAPRRAVRVALKAANLIGDGLYGVDVKESNGQFYVIEVNDNPNVESGVEDSVLRDELYLRIMSVFLRRIEQRKAAYY